MKILNDNGKERWFVHKVEIVKKNIYFILAILIFISFTGCNKANDNNDNKKFENITTVQTFPTILASQDTAIEKNTSSNEVKATEAMPEIIDVDYSECFNGIEGCAVFFNSDTNVYKMYNEELCEKRTSPCSTFKIIATIMGLENGVVDSVDSKMGYDETVYSMDTWNEDLCLKDAFKESCVWYFRKLIDQIGQSEVQTYLNQLGYGNCGTVPVFINGEALMGHGCIGGSILGNSLHGLKMAELAIQILDGSDVNSIPIVDKKTVYFGFDYKVLKKFNVPLGILPSDSIIINKPFSFFETYRIHVIAVSVIFLLMSILIIFLLYMIKLRRIAEARLKENNTELSNLYEEIAISDETLRQNYNELETKQKELGISEEKYRLVAESSMDVFWEIDILTNSVIFSDRIIDLLGYKKGEISTFTAWCEMIHPDDTKQVINDINDHIINNLVHFSPREYRIRSKSKMNKWVLSNAQGTLDENGKLRRVFGAWTDITGIKDQQFKINRLAYFDSVTGLSNRVLLGENIAELISNRDRFTIFFIDVDNFKIINDSYGHLIGDKLLRAMANRLADIHNSSAYRLGGDEFILLRKGFVNTGYTEKFAKNILEELSQPYQIDNDLFYISTSIGIVLYPDDEDNYEELLKNADTALYWSKGNGKGRFSFFNRDMSDDALYKIKIQNDLHRALKENEFNLHYQPSRGFY